MNKGTQPLKAAAALALGLLGLLASGASAQSHASEGHTDQFGNSKIGMRRDLGLYMKTHGGEGMFEVVNTIDEQVKLNIFGRDDDDGAYYSGYPFNAIDLYCEVNCGQWFNEETGAFSNTSGSTYLPLDLMSQQVCSYYPDDLDLQESHARAAYFQSLSVRVGPYPVTFTLGVTASMELDLRTSQGVTHTATQTRGEARLTGNIESRAYGSALWIYWNPWMRAAPSMDLRFIDSRRDFDQVMTLAGPPNNAGPNPSWTGNLAGSWHKVSLEPARLYLAFQGQAWFRGWFFGSYETVVVDEQVPGVGTYYILDRRLVVPIDRPIFRLPW